jgi:cytochrome c oxidase cbb3-type subunit III
MTTTDLSQSLADQLSSDPADETSGKGRPPMPGSGRRKQLGALMFAALLALSSSPGLAQEPGAAGRQGGPVGAPGRGGARGAGQDPRVNVGPSDRPRVDDAAVARGTPLWNAECVTCHGSRARGGQGGPSLLRSAVMFEDRDGSRLGPFFKAGHPMQSGRQSSALSAGDLNDLLNFVLRQRNDSLRGSGLFTVQDILVGDAKAGAEYFAGPGGCAKCHSAAGDLAGIGSRLPAPVDVQQRMMFPSGRGGGRGRGAAPGAGPAAPARTAVVVTLTPATGQPMSGVLVEMDDFFVTFRTASGQLRAVRRTPTLRVAVNDPLQAHHDLLDRLTDKSMSDLTAYLWSLK